MLLPFAKSIKIHVNYLFFVRALSSAEERFLDMEEVTSSILVVPTISYKKLI